jgi:hypothetical protein
MFRQQQRAKGLHVGIAKQLDQVILPFDVMDPKNMGDRQRGLVRSVTHLAGPWPHFARSIHAGIAAAASVGRMLTTVDSPIRAKKARATRL